MCASECHQHGLEYGRLIHLSYAGLDSVEFLDLDLHLIDPNLLLLVAMLALGADSGHQLLQVLLFLRQNLESCLESLNRLVVC